MCVKVVELLFFSGSSPTQSKTRATLSTDGKHYILNGRKAWVVNGSRADVFTVFALTSIPNDKVSILTKRVDLIILPDTL